MRTFIAISILLISFLTVKAENLASTNLSFGKDFSFSNRAKSYVSPKQANQKLDQQIRKLYHKLDKWYTIPVDNYHKTLSNVTLTKGNDYFELENHKGSYAKDIFHRRNSSESHFYRISYNEKKIRSIELRIIKENFHSQKSTVTIITHKLNSNGSIDDIIIKRLDMFARSGRMLSYEQKRFRQLEDFPIGKITVTKLSQINENQVKMEKVDFKKNFYLPTLRKIQETLTIIKGLHRPDKGNKEKVSLSILKNANQW